MAYAGSYKVADTITLYAVTANPGTGAAQAADTPPTYRIYKSNTTVPLVTGTYALLDSVNTTGLYAAQVVLSAGSGFTVTSTYGIYTAATVSGITGTTTDTFQIEAAVAANTVVDKTGYGLSSAERSTLIAALLDLTNGIEANLTPRQALKLMTAVLVGLASGLDTTAPLFKSADLNGGGTAVVGTTTRVTVTGADIFGNRPVITTNLT